MAFEIQCTSGDGPLVLHPVVSKTGSTAIRTDAFSDFADRDGRLYSGLFDGRDVIFHDGESEHVGQWRQGTSATVICQTRLLSGNFSFTFMDHGCSPQRLHAWWHFDGGIGEAIEAWKCADFSISNADRRINRNYPGSSIHMRTKGAFVTGANSSHVIIPSVQRETGTRGEIHVGEFNPFAGLGVGFLLHQMERTALFKNHVNLRRRFRSVREGIGADSR